MSFPRLTAALALACVVLTPAAHAWGQLGHSIVADLAQRHLSPTAEAEVERLLAPENTKSLADIASWPDEIRNDPGKDALWKQTRALHYVDFTHGDCNYTPPRDCEGGQCVVAGIEHYVQILADKSQPDATRLEALKFVVHFIGDEHQPLHGGSRDDKGGNAYQVQFQDKGTNLHSVWDSGLLKTRGLDYKAYADELESRGTVTLPKPIAPFDNAYAQWAEESCQISRDIYPDGHKLNQTYVDKELPVAELRLREAGRRLAEVLNLALAR
ncbi:S1/P1 nuclease [Dyella jiangningensis]|uniref:S1/P1 nuclease n=1 Tax=Dyella jiangningensis TaxID=1379159 RepID=UPI00240FD810|nr:S1/P1 nuclease [Dyella jiangningensis]MDG2539351.1 S1/P1 nuclease [Dyella jiangningensis]